MPAGIGYAKPNIAAPPGWPWGVDPGGNALGPTGDLAEQTDIDSIMGSGSTFYGVPGSGSTSGAPRTAPDRKVHGGLGAILGGLLGGQKFGETAPALPPTSPIPQSTASVTSPHVMPNSPPAPQPKGQSGISPALRGVMTGAGGSDQTNIGALLAQLLKRPRVGV